MFDQTFVEQAQKTRKGWAIALSFWIQVFAICALILIPLVYTHALPNAQLRSLLTAPPPPSNPAPKPPTEAKTQRVVVSRAFDATMLVAPVVIPKKVTDIDEMAAPDVGMSSSVATGSGAANPFNGDLSGTGTEPPAPAPAAKSKPTGPMRIGGIVAEANLIRKVQPAYPPLARSARVQGTVEFTATISKQGNIEHLQLVRGHPLLVEAARQAVLEWKYRPTLLNGQPVEVLTDISVNFTLNP